MDNLCECALHPEKRLFVLEGGEAAEGKNERLRTCLVNPGLDVETGYEKQTEHWRVASSRITLKFLGRDSSMGPSGARPRLRLGLSSRSSFLWA